MLTLCLVLLAAMIVIGAPIAYVIGLPVTLIIFLTTQVPLKIVPQMMTAAVNSFPLMAIPFFLLAGNLMNISGVSHRIFAFAQTLVGHIPGGLGHVSVVASMIFAGMTGSAVAEAGGLGVVELEAMRKRGYDVDFAAGIIVSAATIGPIIPPSVIFVLYGVLAEVSIGALFLAGFVPGVLMGLALMLRVYLISRKKHYPVTPRAKAADVWQGLRGSALALFMPVIIIGGMLGGIFTPTEAAVVAVLYAIILGMFVYRELSWGALWRTLHVTGRQTASVMIITATAVVLGWVLTRSQFSQALTDYVLSVTRDPHLILLLLNIFLLISGCFIEVIAALIIYTPVIAPLLKAVDIDPVHFGVVMTLNLMIGLLTPPFGMGLFVVQKIAQISYEEMVRAALPFILPLIVVLALITYIPELCLWLPRLVLGTG
jgi:tripartite ATP-independent transporter DctM subunit